jgi:hypothetical protein
MIPNPARPRLSYPLDALMPGGDGVVILWFAANEAGELEHLTVLGAVPQGGLPDFATRLAHRWRYEWDESATGCTRRIDRLIAPIQFQKGPRPSAP